MTAIAVVLHPRSHRRPGLLPAGSSRHARQSGFSDSRAVNDSEGGPSLRCRRRILRCAILGRRIIKSATSARGMENPKAGRCPSRTRIFPVWGLSVKLRRSDDRDIETAGAQSGFHASGVGHDAREKQATEKVSRRQQRILEQKAVDTTMARRTLASFMASVRDAAKWRRRWASCLRWALETETPIIRHLDLA